MSCLNADVDQPLSLPLAHYSPTITMVHGGPGLITEDAVSPVTKVPDLVSLASLTTSSPMHESKFGHLAGHRNRYPAARIQFKTVRAAMYLPNVELSATSDEEQK